MDNFSSGKMENIENLVNNKRLELINHDITDYIDIEVE